MGFPASTYRFIDEHASSSTEQCALARPASAICDDMLTQKPSGGGQSEKDCREPHRIGGVARAASVGCVVREPRVIRISPTESIEPPVPSRGRARYVLQVVPGRERAVAERVSERHAFFRALLRAAGVEAVVADEEACRLEHCLCEDSFRKLVTALDARG